MSIHVRATKSSDRARLSNGVVSKVAPRGFGGNLDLTVCDPRIFGKSHEHKQDREKRYDDKYMRTAIIELAKPVLNPFLAGRLYNVWKCVLNKSTKEMENIVQGRVAYNLLAKEDESPWVKRDSLGETPNAENWLYGADILEYLLDNTDIEKRIQDVVYETYIVSHMDRESADDWRKNHVMIGRIIHDTDEEHIGLLRKENNNRVWLFDNYYYTMDTPYKEDDAWLNYIESDVRDFSDSVTRNKYFDVSVLLAVRENPEQLCSQIMREVYVLPIGYRPNIEARIDPLNTAYNNLVMYNNTLNENISYQGYSLKTVMQKYEKVYKQVQVIMVGDSELQKYMGDTFKCLTDTLGGKTGLIRDRMQGVRSDYTGRTVIACSPDMPMDHVGIPKAMLPKLLELNIIASVKNRSNDRRNMSYLMTRRHADDFMRIAEKECAGRYICIGRQPTLWNLGIEAFKVVPVDGSAIVLSPLIVEAFNADFDGDQMHDFFAIGAAADEEVRKLVAIENKLVYPMNGEITVKARHEIAYGLWVCTAEGKRPESKTWTMEAITEAGKKNGLPENRGGMGMVFDLVCKNIIKVYDIVPLGKNYGKDPESTEVTAGVAALKYAIGTKNSNYAIGVSPIVSYGDGGHDKKFKPNWLKDVMTENNLDEKKRFVDIITNITKLGFQVARIFPPSISPICDIDVSEMVGEFNRKIVAQEDLLNRGIEIESSFSTFFNTEFDKLQNNIYKYVREQLGDNNGFVRMMESGAKGSKSNIMQMFGIKGRIMEDDNTPFNTIIGNPLIKGLTGLEHFITAYGARQGIADKTLATAEPGYLTRKLEHCAACMRITTDDCGTTNGILWTYDDIINHCDQSRISGDSRVDIIPVKEMLTKILVGRNVIIGDNTVYVHNISEANNLFSQYVANVDAEDNFHKHMGIKMRSPVTCENPCCAVCYGKDLSALRRKPKIGKAIGFIAAQSLGQPGTQLTMKVFQNGGVATDANLTSSFKKIDTYLGLTDMRSQKGNTNLLSYDALSPVEGRVEAINMGDGRKKIQVLNDEEKNLLGQKQFYVHEDTKLKDYVKVGDSFQETQGDLNIREILRYRSFEEAYKYLILIMYKIYNDEVAVSCQHFEVIIASMCSFIPYTSMDYYRAGESLSVQEYWRVRQDGDVKGQWTIMGLAELPKYRRDFFEAMIMEDAKTNVPRSFIMNPWDEMVNPKTRLSFGLGIGVGSDVAGYLD